MDNIWVLLAVALLPAVLLFLYVWKKDPQKEPTSQLVKAVLWGMFIIIPVLFLESAISAALFGGVTAPTTVLSAVSEAFLVAALPEESFKLLALWLVVRHNRYFDEHYDGIVYAVCVGLGFATVENVSYVMAFNDFPGVAVSRALLAVPVHYSLAVLMGYYYSIYHFSGHSGLASNRILLVPVLFHGIYDAIAFTGALDDELGAICGIVLIIFCIYLHRYAYKKMMAHVAFDRQHAAEEMG